MRDSGPAERKDGVSGRLDFVMRDGDQVARLDAAEWPRAARLSKYKIGIMETTGALERGGDGVWFRVANGWATYRVIQEHDDEIALELVEGEVIWPG